MDETKPEETHKGSEGDGGEGKQHGKKRKRKPQKKRKHDWKPYSQLTWEEKKALEAKDEEKQAKKAMAPALPLTDQAGRIKKGVVIEDYRPGAPRNTSQDLMASPRAHSAGGARMFDKMSDEESEFALDSENMNDFGTMDGLVRKRSPDTQRTHPSIFVLNVEELDTSLWEKNPKRAAEAMASLRKDLSAAKQDNAVLQEENEKLREELAKLRQKIGEEPSP